MNRSFTLSDTSLRMLAAQLQLNGSFRHTCRSAYGQRQIELVMKVERDLEKTQVTIAMGGEKHTLSLVNRAPHNDRTLADFLDAIANGRVDSAEPAPARVLPVMNEPESIVDTAQQEALRDLVRKGGFLDVHVGLEHPVKVAVHRTYNTPGITALLGIGERRPQTSAWTLRQPPAECFRALLESVEHLALMATPKAA